MNELFTTEGNQLLTEEIEKILNSLEVEYVTADEITESVMDIVLNEANVWASEYHINKIAENRGFYDTGLVVKKATSPKELHVISYYFKPECMLKVYVLELEDKVTKVLKVQCLEYNEDFSVETENNSKLVSREPNELGGAVLETDIPVSFKESVTKGVVSQVNGRVTINGLDIYYTDDAKSIR